MKKNWERKRGEGEHRGHKHMSVHSRSAVAHHVRQGKQCGLNLSEVPVFKQVVGLKDVVGLHAVGQDGFDEVPEVLQLQGGEEREEWE